MDDDINQMIEDCKNRESKMTDWEINFISDLDGIDYHPTQKQIDTLEKIWDRITS